RPAAMLTVTWVSLSSICVRYRPSTENRNVNFSMASHLACGRSARRKITPHGEEACALPALAGVRSAPGGSGARRRPRAQIITAGKGNQFHSVALHVHVCPLAMGV